MIDLPHPQYDTNTCILTETTRGVTLAMVYAITSGTLTIDSNEDGRLRGNFEQAAEGDPTLGNAGVIEVSGSFVAVEGF